MPVPDLHRCWPCSAGPRWRCAAGRGHAFPSGPLLAPANPSRASAVPRPFLGRSSAVPRPFLSCASTVSQPCLGRASAVPRPCLGRFSAVPRLFLSRASAVSQPPCLGRSSACFGRSSAVLRPFLSRASAGAGRGEVLRRGRPALGRTAERARQGDADGTFSTAIQPPYSLLKITPRSAKEA